MWRPKILALFLTSIFSSPLLQAQQTTPTIQPEALPTADPARPTVTVPAQIPPVAYLQFEQGLNQAAGSPGLNNQFSVVQTTKLSFTQHLEVQFVTEPFAFTSSAPSSTSRDPGDLILGAQYLFNPSATGYIPDVAVSFNRRVRSGTSANLDIGSFSNSAVVLIQGKLPGLSFISNILFNEQPDSVPSLHSPSPARRAQYGQTLTLTRQLTKPLSFTTELWHFTQPLVFTDRDTLPVAHANAIGLLGNFGYSPRPNLVIDFGVERGLTTTSTVWQGFAGFTYVLPHRLWPKHTS